MAGPNGDKYYYERNSRRLAPVWTRDGNNILFGFDDSILVTNTTGSDAWYLASGVDRKIAYFSPTHAWDYFIIYSYVDYSCIYNNAFLPSEKNGLKIRILDASDSEEDAPFEPPHARDLIVGRNPTWLTDGRRVAFREFGDFFSADAEVNDIERTGLHQVRGDAAWSNDGDRLAAFELIIEECCWFQISHARYDGGDKHTVLNRTEWGITPYADQRFPDMLKWSADDDLIYFTRTWERPDEEDPRPGARIRRIGIYSVKPDGSDLQELYQRDKISLVSYADINVYGETVFSTLDDIVIIDADANEIASWSFDSQLYFAWSPKGDRIAFIDWQGLDGDVMVWTTASNGSDARLLMIVDRQTGEIISRPEFLRDPRVVEYMGVHGYE